MFLIEIVSKIIKFWIISSQQLNNYSVFNNIAVIGMESQES